MDGPPYGGPERRPAGVCPIDLEPLTEDLKAAGLTKDQAKVYIRLLQSGPAKVGDLSQFFDCSRSTLYRLLDELSERGYVTKSLDRPTIYDPSDPEQIFELGMDNIDRARQRLLHVKDKRLEELDRLSAGGEERAVEHRWRKMEGTERIYECLHRMFEEAEASLWAASNHEVTTALYLPVVEEAWRLAYERAAKDGLDVRLLFDFQGEPYTRIPPSVDQEPEGFELRQFDAEETLHFVMTDRRDLLMWIRPSPLGNIGKKDDVAVHTNAPGSVFSHRLLFEKLWEEGAPIGKRD